VAAPSKRGPSAFILASLIETELNLIYLLPLAQASGRYERPSGRKQVKKCLTSSENCLISVIIVAREMSSSPSFSFGGRGVSRDPIRCAKTLFVPGPGAYSARGSTGRQLNSRHKSAAISKFPVTDRSQASRVFAGTATLDFVCSQYPSVLLPLCTSL